MLQNIQNNPMVRVNLGEIDDKLCKSMHYIYLNTYLNIALPNLLIFTSDLFLLYGLN